ncbi:hypothetical protein QUB12_22025 [Microcoleus sp. B7-D4]
MSGFGSVDPLIARHLESSQGKAYRNHYTTVNSRTIRRATERIRRRAAKKLSPRLDNV